ncbi:unnamed protein product [Bursaphelenchus okinawaensis]|uniref:Uncharacterized protein n=1 Tax=Bursaphelenchus okinawaensis TaxID=465554 RepID=A0A811L1I7_9BILA|nr:unnamed protein product [Bursaphelenchus okinawaensis]CAG9114813.1 unnamed protein product [Bursaphelenchus okinawaensis]
MSVRSFFNGLSVSETSVTPFKTAIYVIIAQLSDVFSRITLEDDDFTDEANRYKDELNDRRTYYSFLIWTLIRGPEMSLPILKCFIYHYLNQFDNFFKEFITALIKYEKKVIVPTRIEDGKDKSRASFVKSLTLLGTFIDNFADEYNDMPCDKQFKFSLSWKKFLESTASEEEIQKYSTEWKVDLKEILVKIVDIEENVRHDHQRAKRNVFYKKITVTGKELD